MWECPKCNKSNDNLKCVCGYKLPFYTRILLSMEAWQAFIIFLTLGLFIGCLIYAFIAYIKAQQYVVTKKDGRDGKFKF